MDCLLFAATEYFKLFDIDYIYVLENGVTFHVYFTPGFFHHLAGLHKLTDIPQVSKGNRNNTNYIFKNILNGIIAIEDIQKSRHFNEIEPRLRHFTQINRLIEFEKVIIDFDPSIIKSKVQNADYVLFKRSNDNMYLNLFLKAKGNNLNKQIPLTYLPDITDYYTHSQKILNIASMEKFPRGKV